MLESKTTFSDRASTAQRIRSSALRGSSAAFARTQSIRVSSVMPAALATIQIPARGLQRRSGRARGIAHDARPRERRPPRLCCPSVTTDGANNLSATARLSALQSWRENVLRSLLTVGAVTGPVIVLVSLVFRSGPHSWLRTAALAAAGLAFPTLRLLPGLPAAVRATLAMALCWLTGVVAL